VEWLEPDLGLDVLRLFHTHLPMNQLTFFTHFSLIATTPERGSTRSWSSPTRDSGTTSPLDLSSHTQPLTLPLSVSLSSRPLRDELLLYAYDRLIVTNPL
jgi:hypothetical protein